MNKLQDFPTVYYISLQESKDRQESIENQFSKYNIKPKSLISKRFFESDDIVTGKIAHSMDSGTIGCAVSHLKAIKDWYDNTDENYAFFCEDDLSLDTVEYWNFTWGEFVDSIPEDADCIQLLRLKENNTQEDFQFRIRAENDWSVTAYIVTREYAKKIIDNYCLNDSYHLEIKDVDIMPLVEYLIFRGLGVVYSFPLFVENQEFKSTFNQSPNYNYDVHQTTHLKSYNEVIEWWKSEGKNKTAEDIIFNKKIDKQLKKIVDYTTFYGPTCKEMLELRVHMLKNYVDEFIICESNKSQSGIPIEYELKKTIQELNLSEYNIRVIELNIPDDDNLEIQEIDQHNCYDGNGNNPNSLKARARERMQKDALLSVIDKYDDDTVFIHSDIDEIIKPNNIDYISNIVRNNLHMTIRIPLIHLEGRADLRVYMKDSNSSKEWTGMFIATKQHLKNATPTQIRSNVFNPYPINFITENNVRCEDLGWHFSWMGGSNISKIKSKAFTHYDDTFSYLSSSKYSSQDNQKFLDNLTLKPGDISPSGDKNTVLKYYDPDQLPIDIFRLSRVKKFLLPDYTRENEITKEQLELEVLLNEYSMDTENPEKNFHLGIWYEKQGHTAPALSYFLRAAERSENKLLAYEALIWGSFCYEKQGTRDGTAKTLLQSALTVLPNRPEVYYLLGRFCEKRHWWQEAYLHATQALEFCQFENLEPLNSDFGYPGKCGVIYIKAVSAWWWDRANEARELIVDLKNNYNMNDEFNKLVEKCLVDFKVDSNQIVISNSNELELFENEYQNACSTPSDINENLHILYELSKECNHVTEMGVRNGISTRAFLNSDLKLISYDLQKDPTVESLFEYAKKIGKDVQYFEKDVLKIDIEETDMLFIDTWHEYDQLKKELKKHANKVKKYIVFHDTHSYGVVGEPYTVTIENGYKENPMGLLPAIIEFLIDNSEWRFKIHRTNNNGLTVIERII